jgi:NADP-dependent 3-hydroxy acid dehydrogenase YdfG
MATGALAGQIAVVTGASSGIGRSIAVDLVAEDALVCGIGRDGRALAELGRTVDGPGAMGRLVAYATDLVPDDQRRSVVERILRDHGGVDILVHAAGAIEFGRLATAAIEDFDRQYEVNVRVPYALTQAFLQALAERQGQVVFVNSSAGLRGSAGVGQYAATKHALKAVADSLRDEVNEAGVRVLSVYAGRTATPMQARVHEHEGREYLPDRLLQAADVSSIVIATLLLPRTAEVTDISIRPHRPPA